jgi:hypothetical protein
VILELARTSILHPDRQGAAPVWVLTGLLLIGAVGNIEGAHQWFPVKMRAGLTDLHSGEFSFPRLRASYVSRFPLGAGYASNQETKAVARSVPGDKTLTYLTNGGVGAFVASRTGYWRYPAFADKADFLLIQKDIAPVGIPRGHVPAPSSLGSLPADYTTHLYSRYVDEARSHIVRYDSPHVLLLERREQGALPVPQHLRWFNFLRRAHGGE